MEGQLGRCSGSCSHLWRRVKPFLAVFFLQFGLAGLAIIAKLAMNQGMSPHTLTVYRHAIATILIAPFAIAFERKVRPKMSFSIFIKIVVLGLLEPVIDQNLYYTGMKYTTATFTSAMGNILPALTFFMACILGGKYLTQKVVSLIFETWELLSNKIRIRVANIYLFQTRVLCTELEKLNMKRARSQAKVMGTIVSVGGAMMMTLIKGPIVELFWTKLGKSGSHESESGSNHDQNNMIKGSVMIVAGCVCWASFVILQATTLKTYPAELSLAAWICLMGTIQGSVVALVVEWGNTAAWSLHWDMKLLAALYSGIVCSGIGFYLQGMVMKERGPVFVTAFSPLTMVIVAILGSFVLAEQMYLGRLIGAIAIVAGLYLVVWGKSKDYITSSSSSSINGQIILVEAATSVAGVVDHDPKMSLDDGFVPLDVSNTKTTPTDNQLPQQKL